MSDSGRRRRRSRALVVLALALLVAAPPAFAVGTVVVTTTAVGPSVTKLSFDWTSDAAGAVSGNGLKLPPGHIIQAQFIPDAAGTQPTDLYDATFVDAASVDLLIGAGANLSNTTSKVIIFSPPYYNDGSGNVDLVIANAGNAKGGTFIVWVAP